MATEQTRRRAAMRYSEAFAAAVRDAVGERSGYEVGKRCGLDPGTVSRMLRHGKVPTRETLTAFVDGMDLRGRQRAELFRLAGMVELADRSEAGAGR